jgi:hypothetical protein
MSAVRIIEQAGGRGERERERKEANIMNAPAYVAPCVMIGAVAVIATVLFGLHRTLTLAPGPTGDRRRIQWISAVLVGWFCVALWTSGLGLYQAGPNGIPTSQYGLFVPILVGIVLYWRWPALRRVIEAVAQEWIVGVQVYRVLGVIFLVLLAEGRVPGDFARPAGGGDVRSVPVSSRATRNSSRT